MGKKAIWLLILGFVLGAAAGAAVTLCFTLPKASTGEGTDNAVSQRKDVSEDSTRETTEETTVETETDTPETDASAAGEDTPESAVWSAYPEWNAETVYNGGEKIVYQNRIYRAKWWTQGEMPGQADVWEDTLESPVALPDMSAAEEDAGEKKAEPIDLGDIKVVGYFPSWKPGEAKNIRYDVITHVVYAFAIPTAEGGLRPLDEPETAKKIIKDAHDAGRKVLLAVGGWSYNDTPLEATFVSATESEEKRASFVKAIIDMCEEYGFDGIDMDWEHPRVDGASAGQYEATMLALAKELHERDKVLTSAVLSGATADGNIYYDAAAHSDKVLEAVDWIHVMAYDGGDGERHSSYDFAVNSATYWKDVRGLPAEKVILGVPFYARPSWAAYGDILAAAPDAWKSDNVSYNGMDVWYNGVDTIQQKTRYAVDNLGGVMIWEITQDTKDREKSLHTAIAEEILKGQ